LRTKLAYCPKDTSLKSLRSADVEMGYLFKVIKSMGIADLDLIERKEPFCSSKAMVSGTLICVMQFVLSVLSRLVWI